MNKATVKKQIEKREKDGDEKSILFTKIDGGWAIKRLIGTITTLDTLELAASILHKEGFAVVKSKG